MNKNKAYRIVMCDFIKAINTNKGNEELTEELWHCAIQIDKLKQGLINKKKTNKNFKSFFKKILDKS